MAKYLDITRTTYANAFIVSGDPSGVNNNVAIDVPNIITVSGVFVAGPSATPTNPLVRPTDADATSNIWTYPYANKTLVHIEIVGGRHEVIELQSLSTFVGGTAGWDAGTQAALNQAVADIQAKL